MKKLIAIVLVAAAFSYYFGGQAIESVDSQVKARAELLATI